MNEPIRRADLLNGSAPLPSEGVIDKMNTGRIHKSLFRCSLPVLVSALLTLPSCVYDREMTILNDEINALNRRVTQIQETMNTTLTTDLEARLDQIRTNQKTVRLEIDELRSEVKDLSGRTEDNEHIIKRTVERDLGEQDVQKATLDNLSRRIAVLEAEVKRHQEYLGLEAMVPTTVPEAEALPDKEQPASLPAEATVDPKAQEIGLYDKSLAAYKEGRYETAMDGFKDFLNRYPKSDRADNAQFWIGESHMALKQYEQAILAFQKVIKNFPKGNKVPNALLRQSLAFWEIKDKTSARLLLKKIIQKYPKSNEANIAAKRLQTMK